MNPLKQLEACGQSPWLDNLQHSLIEKGELRRLIEEDGLKGITSNPSIFEKAIGETEEYTEAIEAFMARGHHEDSEIYEHLAMADIRAAADALRPVYEATGGGDGFVSLECSPYLADDTEATIAEAHKLWTHVARPNLMVKVPATPAGIPAIRSLIGEGLNINVTLLFSQSVYEQVASAYLDGLKILAKARGDLSRVASVASLFVSRIDTAVDKQLEALGDADLADRLRGKAAIANAKQVYARFKKIYSGPDWELLARLGARPQRLLWASTSVKDHHHKDTAYVEALIGRDTVDTLPPATLDAFRDHGQPEADAIESGLDDARSTLAELAEHGISVEKIGETLVRDGVRQFTDAFDKLLFAISQQRLRAEHAEEEKQQQAHHEAKS